MKIAALDLIAYGHFHNHRLDLSGGQHGLHVIYGPNEAGKTTTLRAITALLFGFDNITQDDFRHGRRDLRVGASIIDADGRQIDCVRRKGRVNTLYDGRDSATIDEALVQRMMPGIDKAAFLSRFGLSHQALVDGGQLMVQGNGDVGQSLFAAGAGMSHLKKVIDSLESQCGELFKKGGRNAQLNGLLGELNEQRRSLRDSSLPVKEYEQLTRKSQEVTAASENFRQAIVEARKQLKYNQSLRDAIPLVAERRQLQDQLKSLGNARVLAADFPSRHQQTLSKASGNAEKRRLLQRLIDQRGEALDALGQPSVLLSHAETIELLVQATGGIQKGELDRPGLLKRRDLTHGEIVAAMKSIGRHDSSQASALHLPHEMRMKISELASQYEKLTDQAVEADRELDSLQMQCELIESDLASLGPERNFEKLAAALQQAGDVSALVQDFDAAGDRCQREQRQVDQQLCELALGDCSADAAIELPVPSQASVEAFAQQLDAINQQRQQLATRQTECEATLDRLTTEMQKLRGGGDVPSEAELDQARKTRDALGQQMRQDNASANFDASADAFFESVRHCDLLSDRLRREAQRVSRRVAIEADSDAAKRTQQRLWQQAEELQSQDDAFGSQWAALWAPCRVVPRSPREMLQWLGQFRRLTDLVHTLGEARVALNRARDRMSRLSVQIREAMASAMGDETAGGAAIDGVAKTSAERAAAPAADLISLVQQASAELARLRGHQQRRDDAVKLKKQIDAAIPSAQRNHQRRQSALQDWKQKWLGVTQKLQLDDSASTSEVNSVLDVYNNVIALQRRCDDFQQRIDGIDADAAAFEQKVKQAGLPIANESMTASQLVQAWSSELKVAQKQQGQRDTLEADLEKAQRELDALQQEEVDNRAQLQALCDEARCDQPGQLPQAMQDSDSKQRLEQRQNELTLRLNQLAGSTPLEAFVESVSQSDDEQLQIDIEQIESRLAELSGDLETALMEQGQIDQQLKSMNGGDHAAQAQQSIEDLLGRIDAKSQQYARLRVAQTMLQLALARYRQRNEAPVLTIASEYFRRLTLGKYDRLRTDNNDKGQPILLGVRSDNGQSIDLQGMSQGTADQLYLALRLATIKHYLNSGPAIPLIVDDILIQCDLQRSAAALELLAEISDDTQVIFFTHNEALVDVARGCVDQERLFIQELSFPTDSETSKRLGELEQPSGAALF